MLKKYVPVCSRNFREDKMSVIESELPHRHQSKNKLSFGVYNMANYLMDLDIGINSRKAGLSRKNKCELQLFHKR